MDPRSTVEGGGNGDTGFAALYLIVYPEGTLAWDVGQVLIRTFRTMGPWCSRPFCAPRADVHAVAGVGYQPQDITYVAMSHYHADQWPMETPSPSRPG